MLPTDLGGEYRDSPRLRCSQSRRLWAVMEVQAAFCWSSLFPAPFPALLPKSWWPVAKQTLGYRSPEVAATQKRQLLRDLTIEPHLNHPSGD